MSKPSDKPLRIVFDCRYTRTDRHDGISRYTAGLVTELSRLHPGSWFVRRPAPSNRSWR
jgi:hypothetical protein